jgi:hypothetical protein
VGLVLAFALAATGQFVRRPKPDKGPRALGLLELAPNGKAHLIPIVIMYNGEFYDASAYKADPVPMALDSGTVYEAERSGTSLGLFTVTGALAGRNNTWTGAGTWLPAGAHPPSKGHRAEAEPRGLAETDEPPVLRRSEPKKPEPPPQATSSAPSSPAAQPESPKTPPPAAPAPAPTASVPPATASAASPQEADEDSGRPILRRGKPSPESEEVVQTPSAVPAKAVAPATSVVAKSSKTEIRIIPAISDAGGPEPHSYAYPLKTGEEPQLRQKVLAMAAEEVEARAQRLASEMIGVSPPATKPSRRRKVAAKPPQPKFDDVQFHVFDLSSSNQAVTVLTARAQVPQGPAAGPANLQYMVTLVAGQDIYGDLHKIFSNVTDTQHLDVLPRYDFIDVVDVDGDGRGELLFRRVSDTSSAYTVFRVIGQQVWPLFEGRLQ